MGFFKDASESLFTYSEKLITKTEEYARIAKLTMDIKRLEMSIGRINAEVGEYVVKRADAGDASIALSDEFIVEKTRAIAGVREEIEAKRQEIAAIKSARPTDRGGSGAQ
ncbi:MAG TPA: hypothetical protein PKM65_02150 [Spirochaetota bacterium]|nr:hypothetical protein [Spirochaetota bacterium]HNT12653.1 hypothetical protein [Spirochaetota bacterium]HNV47789.1 hypothetical protein [Spirochaetota bacterium]HOS39976.1 hypothetical protein [Spirochaetota bacterium]HPU89619.1 hypothetical protein [Spirochaetota bacterium]